MKGFIILFLPWVLATFFSVDPVISYFIAWLGSFFIFYITLTGKIVPIPTDLGIAEQLMRPVFLMQLIFAGYMACTSIFYFFDLLGYVNFQKSNVYFLVDQNKLAMTAQCQRYYCLGHAAFASGILAFMKYPVKKRYHTEKKTLATFLLKFALIGFAVAVIIDKLPGLNQFSNQFNAISFMGGTLALAFAIPLKKAANIIICLILYFFNFYQALVSGYKEPIIISVLVLGVFLYPSYKKIIILTFIPLLFTLFILLPTYNRIFRQNSWDDNTGDEQSAQLALKATLEQGSSSDSNWSFFVSRLSEIEMFTQYVKSTPDQIDYYGLTFLKQSAVAIIPRVLWPSKPSTEDVVMQRVYNANVVSRASDVSAKPPFIVDTYLSGGLLGIIIFMFAYGAIAQLIALKAEELFGGYILGTALVFSGLFQIFWRGLSFEFLINTVFWSYITMLIIHKVLLMSGTLREIETDFTH
jgi:hypothetical protein